MPRELSGDPGANVTVNKIFIGGIRDKPVTKEDLEAYFGSFGTIRVNSTSRRRTGQMVVHLDQKNVLEIEAVYIVDFNFIGFTVN